MFYSIFSTIFPVFGLILLGLLLKQTKFLPEEFFRASNKLAFWVALPCLLFHKIAVAELEIAQASRILIVMFAGTTVMILLSWMLAKAMKLAPKSLAAFVHASFRGNLAYIGLPVIIYSLSSDNVADLQGAEALAVLCLAPVVPFYNVVAIIFLEAAGSGKRLSLLKLIVQSLKNPLLVACILGFVFSLFTVPIPVPIDRALGLVSAVALPLTLLAIGASLSIAAIKASSIPAAAATFLKIAVMPVVAFALVKVLELNPMEARIAMVYMTTPTAVAAYVMTEQMKCDAVITSSAVVLSTILSIISFSIAIIAT